MPAPQARGPLYPLGDFSAMVQLLAQVLEVPLRDAERRLRVELDRPGSNMRHDFAAYQLTPFEWSERVAEFYRQSHAYLYESIVANHLPSKRAVRRWIIEYLAREGRAAQRVLCVGDGLGFASAELALAGHSVVYYEVSNACRNFATEVFTRNAARVEVAATLAALEPRSFDVVVCLDVLEHMPNPSLYVGALTQLLSPSGLLIAHAPFWRLDPAAPTHLRQNLRFCGDWRSLYGIHGLRPRAARYLWHPIVLERKQQAARARSLTSRLTLALGGLLLRSQRRLRWPLTQIARAVLHMEVQSYRRQLLG